MSAKTYRCSRCHRRYRDTAKDADLWNAVFRDGRMTGVLCPDCQTAGEDLEASVNDAMIDYSTTRLLPDGRAYASYRRTVKA
ncbi:hypothetical protein G1C96_1911 [Bifidobacterium sp. DSM 109958]|uniref:Uncharacterized protein n=1 Tax=Bifidobacterium moraviense TaxID=2675323 RepID=A0A7Y0F567_9BIFI|nr:hypothetical protein [Bifidobacterium sp. DSM 109958]NMN01322.1 hypothetical protein [Bifidobacterium sp. DSM 109958]